MLAERFHPSQPAQGVAHVVVERTSIRISIEENIEAMNQDFLGGELDRTHPYGQMRPVAKKRLTSSSVGSAVRAPTARHLSAATALANLKVSSTERPFSSP